MKELKSASLHNYPTNFIKDSLDDELRELDEESTIMPEELEFGPGNFEAIRHTCEAIGQIIESWGFKKIMGSMWAFLYLCPEPASAKDICDALKVSPALVSITLQELIRWEVIKKISPLGKRKDYYVAEHDVWKMIRKVFAEREKKQMVHVQEKLRMALEALENEKNSRPDLKSKRTCQFQTLRVEDLLSVTNSASQLLGTFLDSGKMDIGPIYSALKPYTVLLKGIKGQN